MSMRMRNFSRPKRSKSLPMLGGMEDITSHLINSRAVRGHNKTANDGIQGILAEFAGAG